MTKHFAILDIAQKLYLAGTKILRISHDATAARDPLNLIEEKAIKDYVDSVVGTGGGSGSNNVDGGFPFSLYLVPQNVDGGTP